jgi:hypothetical protein
MYLKSTNMFITTEIRRLICVFINPSDVRHTSGNTLMFVRSVSCGALWLLCPALGRRESAIENAVLGTMFAPEGEET